MAADSFLRRSLNRRPFAVSIHVFLVVVYMLFVLFVAIEGKLLFNCTSQWPMRSI